MTDCCTLPPREAPAIPLWINGRPVLAMPESFAEIRESSTQRLLRRVPLVDLDLARSALKNNTQVAGWDRTLVPQFLQALSQDLVSLEAHFAGLSAVECQTHLDQGKADVAAALHCIDALSVPTHVSLPASGTILAIAESANPVTTTLQLVLPVIVQGGCVTLIPDAGSPSCALALAELCGQCGLPDGVFNVIYVSEDRVRVLIAENSVAQGSKRL